MKAMILAAGRGRRLRPLTDHLPKSLVEVGGRALIDWHLRALARAGFEAVVINLSWHGKQIRAHVGDGSAFGIEVRYSDEGEQALDTGGGIYHALPLLGTAPFAVINADVFTEYPLEQLRRCQPGAAHLVLVPNPEHNPEGDFALKAGQIAATGAPRYTFAGLGVYHPQLFAGCEPGQFRLSDVLAPAISGGRVSGELYAGHWIDVGTQERLARARALVGEAGAGSRD